MESAIQNTQSKGAIQPDMRLARVVGVYGGKVRQWRSAGKCFKTAIFKSPLTGKVAVTKDGIAGDDQADRKHHGGPDKVLCLFADTQYDRLESHFNRVFPRPAFGENLLLSGVDDSDLCIGDTLNIGSALLQVSQPRRPCYKISAIYEEPGLAWYFQDTGYTGCYLRCLQAGLICAGDEVRLHSCEEQRFSIKEVNRMLYEKDADAAGIRELLSLVSLSASLRAILERRLAGKCDDDRQRLYGEG
jgi:MOSC domain-containing protein YiiM